MRKIRRRIRITYLWCAAVFLWGNIQQVAYASENVKEEYMTVCDINVKTGIQENCTDSEEWVEEKEADELLLEMEVPEGAEKLPETGLKELPDGAEIPVDPDGEEAPMNPDGEEAPVDPDGEGAPVNPDGEEAPMDPDGEEAPMNPDGEEAPVDPDGEEAPVHPDGEEAPVDPDGEEAPVDPDGEEAPMDPDDEEVQIYAIARASIGISDSPQIGQVNTYGCTGGVQVWTVPSSGRYRISCYGGYGGGQNTPGDSLEGGRGSIREGTILLEKGTILYIHVGGNGLGGNRQSHGAPTGHESTYNGGAAAGYDENDLGNKGRYWTHGTGGGASDVRMGGNGLNNQIIVAGGGGGANKDTRGSNADSGKYNGQRLNGSYEGGGGGYYGGAEHQGGSSYVDTARFTDVSVSNGGSASAQITIRVVSLFPQIKLSAPEGWTNQDVTINAAVLMEGEGLTGDYLSWEQDDAGNDLWTADPNYTVSQNGTYTCKIRDKTGNTTEKSITISNIDRLNPVIQEITVSEKEWTKEDVVLTALAEDAEETAAYGRAGLPADAYLWGALEPSGNILWGYGGREGADGGNSGEEERAERAVTAVPEDPDGAGEGVEPGPAPEDPAPDPEWMDSPEFTVSGNGTYICRVRDKAGNVSEMTCKVTNIDRLEPDVELFPSTAKWTNEDIILYADGDDHVDEGSDGKSGIQDSGYAWGYLDVSGEVQWIASEDEGADTDDTESLEEDKEVTEGGAEAGETGVQEENGDTGIHEEGNQEEKQAPVWTGQDTCTVSQNGTYICLVRDNADNVSELKIHIDNIDRLMPEADLEVSTTEKAKRVTLTAVAEDKEATEKYGRSGIQDYGWELQGSGIRIWTSANTYIAEKNWMYICLVRDRAGNLCKLQQNITNVDESSGGGGGSGITPPGPVQQPENPVQTEPPGAKQPEMDELLKWLKGLLESSNEYNSIPEAEQDMRAGAVPGKERYEERKNEKETEGWKGKDTYDSDFMKGNPRKNNITDEYRRDGEEEKDPYMSEIWRCIIALALAGLCGIVLFILYFIFLCLARSADIMAMDNSGEYVLIGKRKIVKRRDVYQIRIGNRLYSRAETDSFEIRPVKQFVEENKGEWMLIFCQGRQIPVMINEEMKLTIPAGEGGMCGKRIE